MRSFVIEKKEIFIFNSTIDLLNEEGKVLYIAKLEIKKSPKK